MPRELKVLPVEKQRPLLEKVARLEGRMAASLEQVPAPTGLNAEERTTYLKGLAAAAKEFREQGAEFRKAAETLDQTSASRTPASAQEWPWVESDHTSSTIMFVKGSRVLAALIILDLKRAHKEISDRDYFSLRSGALITALPQNLTLQRYLYRELKAANQNEVLGGWKWPI